MGVRGFTHVDYLVSSQRYYSIVYIIAKYIKNSEKNQSINFSTYNLISSEHVQVGSMSSLGSLISPFVKHTDNTVKEETLIDDHDFLAHNNH